MRILLLDIETAPNLGYFWSCWQNGINPEWIAANGHVLCWSAKWFRHPKTKFRRLNGSPKTLLSPIHDLLNEADVVVHFNGKKFDIPTLNKEFVVHGFSPPSPYKQVDLYQVARNRFRFPSNKMDYIAQTLGIGSKLRHPGPQLWIDCMANRPEAWRLMRAYNQQDVVLLERMYERLLPWVPKHPNHGAHDDTSSCPNCGSHNIQRRGIHVAQQRRFQKFQCLGCGAWFRGTAPLSTLRHPRYEPL